MVSIAQPGAQQRLKPAPPAEGVNASTPFGQWFFNFLREELKPYPGRGTLASRYILAATITMLFIMVFRLPGASVGGFYSLLLSRESPTTTLRGGFTILVAFLLGLVFVLLGAILFVDYPLTHFLWLAGSFFVAFYGISALSNYAAATAFGIVIVLSIPIWDQTDSQAALVVANLWTAASVAVAILATIAVEYAFSLFETKDELKQGLTERLRVVCGMLQEAARGDKNPPAEGKLRQFAIIGVSRLRRLALSQNFSRDETARLSTTVSQTGRLVDIIAAPQHFCDFAASESPQLQALAHQVALLEQRLENPNLRVPALPEDLVENCSPILVTLRQTIELLRMSLTPEGISQASEADQILPSEPSLFKPDIFSNPDHLKFALRGCLASVLCYVLFTSVFWPALSPSLFTCVITALISIGTSRQKQVLRISGAIFGGLILGMGSQIFILPQLDTIVGFTVLFVVVTSAAAWIVTSSPRLSYFGSQMALAFYLIQLRSPFPQTNLAIARDNVMGILLGLVVMWLVFDQLGSKPAVQVMRDLFAENLILMAQLARPWPHGRAADLTKIRTLRDRISQNFSSVNSQADAVLFEVGASRKRSLHLRDQLLTWQPHLRSLFLLEVATLQYRLQVTPQQLDQRVFRASDNFDRQVCASLERLAETFRKPHNSGWNEPDRDDLNAAFLAFREAVAEAYQGSPPIRAQAVLALLAQIVELITTLTDEINEGTQIGLIPATV